MCLKLTRSAITDSNGLVEPNETLSSSPSIISTKIHSLVQGVPLNGFECNSGRPSFSLALGKW